MGCNCRGSGLSWFPDFFPDPGRTKPRASSWRKVHDGTRCFEWTISRGRFFPGRFLDFVLRPTFTGCASGIWMSASAIRREIPGCGVVSRRMRTHFAPPFVDGRRTDLHPSTIQASSSDRSHRIIDPILRGGGISPASLSRCTVLGEHLIFFATSSTVKSDQPSTDSETFDMILSFGKA